jgi:hypothetical protein
MAPRATARVKMRESFAAGGKLSVRIRVFSSVLKKRGISHRRVVQPTEMRLARIVGVQNR